MSKIVLYMSMSVDGFIAGPNDEVGHGFGASAEDLDHQVTHLRYRVGR